MKKTATFCDTLWNFSFFSTPKLHLTAIKAHNFNWNMHRRTNKNPTCFDNIAYQHLWKGEMVHCSHRNGNVLVYVWCSDLGGKFIFSFFSHLFLACIFFHKHKIKSYLQKWYIFFRKITVKGANSHFALHGRIISSHATQKGKAKKDTQSYCMSFDLIGSKFGVHVPLCLFLFTVLTWLAEGRSQVTKSRFYQ